MADVVSNASTYDPINILENIISIPSDTPRSKEARIAEYICELLKKLNVRHEVFSLEEGRPNVIAVLGGDNVFGDKDALIFNGHIDTKPAGDGWKTDPFKPHRWDDKIYGLGACDTKASIAAFLATIAEVRKEKMLRPVVFQFVADEEMNSAFGTKFLVSKFDICGAFAIVGEPTDMTIVKRSLGNAWKTVNIVGVKSHAGCHTNGVNAIHVASEIICAFRRTVIKEANDAFFPEFPNVNVGKICGGEHPGSVPDQCSFTLDLRFQDEKYRNELVRGLTSTVKTICDNFGATCSIEDYEGTGMLAWDIEHHKNFSNKFGILEQSFLEVCGNTAAFSSFLGGSDAGHLSEVCHIPTVIFGPGSLKQAHRPNEFVPINEVYRAARVYQTMASKWGNLSR